MPNCSTACRARSIWCTTHLSKRCGSTFSLHLTRPKLRWISATSLVSNRTAVFAGVKDFPPVAERKTKARVLPHPRTLGAVHLRQAHVRWLRFQVPDSVGLSIRDRFEHPRVVERVPRSSQDLAVRIHDRAGLPVAGLVELVRSLQVALGVLGYEVPMSREYRGGHARS